MGWSVTGSVRQNLSEKGCRVSHPYWASWPHSGVDPHEDDPAVPVSGPLSS
jgi:hypothetical protein